MSKSAQHKHGPLLTGNRSYGNLITHLNKTGFFQNCGCVSLYILMLRTILKTFLKAAPNKKNGMSTFLPSHKLSNQNKHDELGTAE